MADKPMQSGSQYSISCQIGADKYPETAKNAASVITLNPDNYLQLDQAIKERCQNSRTKICVDILATLEDAASYVISSDHVPEKEAGSNGSTK